MEMVQGTHDSASEEDFISRMPEIVITNIMDRLPIQDAVRTSILSTNWRFKWTLLSQLVFNEKFFENFVGVEGANSYKLRKVIGILLQLKGAITKFVLWLPHHIIIDDEDINHWFLFLSGKGIKEVILINMHETKLKLPSYLFSCRDLKHLNLLNSCFDPPPSFHGFPKLLSLNLTLVQSENFKCGELITRCPLLKALSIDSCILSEKVKLAEIAKLKNLKFLSLSLKNLDIRSVTSFSIFQLVGSLPKLQELNLNFEMCKFLAEAGAGKSVLTSFPCLKKLQLRSMNFGDDVMVSYVFEMISCSPNLHTLKISDSVDNDVPPTARCSSDLSHKTMWLLQLRNIVFSPFSGCENEVCLIKYLLACSPFLKTMHIELNCSTRVGREGINFNLAKKLLKLHRASRVAEIDLT